MSFVHYFYPVNNAWRPTLCFMKKAVHKSGSNLSKKTLACIHIFLPLAKIESKQLSRTFSVFSKFKPHKEWVNCPIVPHFICTLILFFFKAIRISCRFILYSIYRLYVLSLLYIKTQFSLRYLVNHLRLPEEITAQTILRMAFLSLNTVWSLTLNQIKHKHILLFEDCMKN